MTKEIQITSVNKDVLQDMDFYPPAKYYFIDALGQANFIHVRKLEDAQKYINENYGVNKYRPVAAKQGSAKGEYSARGTTSRKGTASHLRKTV